MTAAQQVTSGVYDRRPNRPDQLTLGVNCTQNSGNMAENTKASRWPIPMSVNIINNVSSRFHGNFTSVHPTIVLYYRGYIL